MLMNIYLIMKEYIMHSLKGSKSAWHAASEFKPQDKRFIGCSVQQFKHRPVDELVFGVIDIERTEE